MRTPNTTPELVPVSQALLVERPLDGALMQYCCWPPPGCDRPQSPGPFTFLEGTGAGGTVPLHPNHREQGAEIFPDPGESCRFEEAIRWVRSDTPQTPPLSVFQPPSRGLLRFVVRSRSGSPPNPKPMCNVDVQSCAWCKAGCLSTRSFCKGSVRDWAGMFYTLKIKAAFFPAPPGFYSENKQNPNSLRSDGKAGSARARSR